MELIALLVVPVAAVVVVLGCWLPGPLGRLIQQTAGIVGGGA